MNLTAKLEIGLVNLYNEDNLLIGSVSSDKDFVNSQIKIGDVKYYLTRNKWETEVSTGESVINHLKTNKFSGITDIFESGIRITGDWGLKWGTKLVDNNKNTLLKIRNEKQLIHNNQYIIQVDNDKTTDLDVLLTLYGHIYGSKMKQQSVFMFIVIIFVFTINGLI